MALFVYGSFVGTVKLKPPKLEKQQIDISPLLSKFKALYPQYPQEEGVEDKPSITLLATATGFIRLALIQVNGEEQTVRIGSKIGSYTVAHIDRNYIMLSKGEDKMAAGFSLKEEPKKMGTLSPSTTPTGDKTITSSRSLQANIPRGELERITADPGIMFRQIRMVPFVQGGRTRGFLFEWIEPESIFERAGIQPGDVLLSINNQEIRSGEDAFRILQLLRNESTIKLNLQRDSELIELSLRIE
ncbi:MAG: PDZ domain-containing protein [Aquificaceae bacterium]